jgi:Arc/MetJ-type ribon-helix-helix transcriptional regulator
MIKRTFVLDEESSTHLDRASERTGLSKSQVVREALRLYGEQLGRLTQEERERLLAAFDRTIEEVPDRPREEVQAELAEITRARRAGGRHRT